MKKISIFFMCLMLVLSTIGFSTAEDNTIYVDDDGTADYTSIQEAIDAASEGDNIFVYTGTYYEHLDIRTKSLILQGEDKETTIIDAQGVDDVINIWADKVTITGFTIQHSGSNYWDDGIEICADYTTISDNIIKECDGGIYMWNCRYNSITSNIIDNNVDNGIELVGVIWSSVEQNEIINNNKNFESTGMMIEHVNAVKIRNNNFSNNHIGLTVLDSAVAPWLFPAQQNWIMNNNFVDNHIHAGVYDRNNAYGSNFLCMRFLHNYWGGPRLPFKIIWVLDYFSSDIQIKFPCNFDLFPSLIPVNR